MVVVVEDTVVITIMVDVDVSSGRVVVVVLPEVVVKTIVEVCWPPPQKQQATCSAAWLQYAEPPSWSYVEHVCTPPPDQASGRALSTHKGESTRVVVSVLMPTIVVVVVVDAAPEVVVSVFAIVEVVSTCVSVVDVVMAFVVEACFHTAQSGHPPSDTEREGSQLLKASVMPSQPPKLNNDATPITLAAWQ